MLFIKNIRRRRKANASDAKSHYKVTSRTKKVKQSKPKKVAEEFEEVEEIEEYVQEQDEEVPTEEQSLDSYVYGDVQDFGADEQPEEVETTEESSEQE